MTAATPKREAVAVFEDVADLDDAVRALLDAGFSRSDLSLLAGRHTVERKLGAAYHRVEELEDDPSVPRVAYRRLADTAAREGGFISALSWAPPLLAAGAVVASTGIVTGLIIGAAVAGSLAANVFAHVLDRRHADWLQEQLDAGGILLWVRLGDEDAVKEALRVLTRHAVHDVHVHEIPADPNPSDARAAG